ncbi:MAG: molecular chaperone DnaJ [Candidatus Sedimenticola sp. (ex Thyasira tokunagai)]
MEFSGDIFPSPFLWVISVCYLLLFLYALYQAPWRRLINGGVLNVYFGSCVTLLLLWTMRVATNDQLTFHLLGITAMTLMFGWSLTVVLGGIVLGGVTLNSAGSWELFAVNAFTTSVIPATISITALVMVRSLLPKNFFIYVLVNGFLTAGLAALISGYLAVGLLVASGVFTLAELEQGLMPFFPLMFMPEAFLNGWAITMMVLYRPHWVYSFSDRLYLDGK